MTDNMNSLDFFFFEGVECLRFRVFFKNDFQSRLLQSLFLPKKNLKTTSSVKRAELVFCGAFSIFFWKNDFEKDDFESLF